MARFRRADRPYTYSLKPGEGNRGMFRANSFGIKSQGQVTPQARQDFRMSRLEENRYSANIRIMKPMATQDVGQSEVRRYGIGQYRYMPKSFQSKRAAQSAKNADLAVFKEQYGKGSNRFRRGNK
jgi:hypothetical protein